MKKVIFLGLAVLLLGIGGAASAAPATTKYDEGVVYGHWVCNEAGNPLDYEGVLYARQDKQGFHYVGLPDLEWSVFFEIQCLRIEGNRAWAAEVTTLTNVPGSTAGNWAVQMFVDNGDSDEVYSMFLPKEEALHACQSKALLEESESARAFYMVEGDMVIIDKHD